MTIIIDFNKYLNHKAEDAFITVLKSDEAHILWNKSQLFYIKSSIYPIKQHIFTYANISGRDKACKVAHWILNNLRLENKGKPTYDQIEDKP